MQNLKGGNGTRRHHRAATHAYETPGQVKILYAHAAAAAPPNIQSVVGRTNRTANRPTADPNTATCNAPQNVTAVPRARINPIGWAAKEAANDPSAAWAKAVVIPQLGQGLPRCDAQAHGSIPNCVCVPCPSDEGANHVATISSDSDAPASNPARTRWPPVPCQNER